MENNYYIKADSNSILLTFPLEQNQNYVEGKAIIKTACKLDTVLTTGLSNFVLKKNNVPRDLPLNVQPGDIISATFNSATLPDQLLISGTQPAGQEQEPFVLKVNSGTSGSYYINTLAGSNYSIKTSDGHNLTNLTSSTLINFSSLNTDYIIYINGSSPRLRIGAYNTNSNRTKTLEVMQWGDIPWLDMIQTFYGCINLQVTALDTPNLTQCTTMQQTFYNCTTLDFDVSEWDVSNITYIYMVFQNCYRFNSDLSNWVINANVFAPLYNCQSFNHPIDFSNTSTYVSIYNFLYNSRVPSLILDASNVANVNNNSFNTQTLKVLILYNMSVSFNIANSGLLGTGINNLANSVKDLTGGTSQSITMTVAQRNSCNQSLWLNKNWSITAI